MLVTDCITALLVNLLSVYITTSSTELITSINLHDKETEVQLGNLIIKSHVNTVKDRLGPEKEFKKTMTVELEKDTSERFRQKRSQTEDFVSTITRPEDNFPTQVLGADVEINDIMDGSLKNPVVIGDWHNELSMDHRSFSVDNTINTLLLDVHSGKNSPRITIYDPTDADVREDGNNVIMKYTDDGRRRSMEIKHPLPGVWNLTFPDRHRYNITVRANSVLQFQSEFIDHGGFEMSGNPVTGTNTTLVINILGMEYLKSLDDVFLTSLTGRSIMVQRLSGPIGRLNDSYKAVIRIPSEILSDDETFYYATFCSGCNHEGHCVPFKEEINICATLDEENSYFHFRRWNSTCTRHWLDCQYGLKIGIQGQDKDSHLVTRIHIDEVTPEGIKLKLKNVTPGTMMAGGTYVLRYTITNDGRAGRFKLDVLEDTKDFKFSVIPNYQIIPPRGQKSGNVTVHVSQNAAPGSSSNMVVLVTSESGETQYTSRIFVVKEKTHRGDTHPPEFYQTNVVDNCRHNDSCEDDRWNVVFQVEDDESGLHRVDVDDHTVSTVTMETFNDGVVNTFVNGTISTNCCRKQVTVIVEDVQGNKGRIPIVYPENSVQNITVPSGAEEELSSLQIGAVVVGSLTGCLVLVIIVTLFIQYNKQLKNLVHHEKSKEIPNYRRKVKTISGNKVV